MGTSSSWAVWGEAQDAPAYTAAVFLGGGMCYGAAEEDVEEHETWVHQGQWRWCAAWW